MSGLKRKHSFRRHYSHPVPYRRTLRRRRLFRRLAAASVCVATENCIVAPICTCVAAILPRCEVCVPSVCWMVTIWVPTSHLMGAEAGGTSATVMAAAVSKTGKLCPFASAERTVLLTLSLDDSSAGPALRWRVGIASGLSTALPAMPNFSIICGLR